MIALIDGNNLAYVGGSVSSHLQTSEGEGTGYIYGFLNELQRSLSAIMPDQVIVTWDHGHSKQRLAIYPEYKVRRKVDVDPLEKQKRVDARLQCAKCIPILKSLSVPQIKIEGVEGDDIIAELCGYFAEEEIVIVSTDRDYLQLVNERIRIYQPIKNEMYDLDNFGQASKGIPREHFLGVKILTGDASDAIPGVSKGFGPKTALRVLRELGGIENVLRHPRPHPKLDEDWLDKALRNLSLVVFGFLNEKGLSQKIRTECTSNYPLLPIDEVKFRRFLKVYELASIWASYASWIDPFRRLQEKDGQCCGYSR